MLLLSTILPVSTSVLAAFCCNIINFCYKRKISIEFYRRYIFQITSYLIGVFVFATIVGQVGNVINNYNASRHEYEQLLVGLSPPAPISASLILSSSSLNYCFSLIQDGAKFYMRRHEVPKEMQVRVQRWYNYAWTNGRMNGALDINSLQMLPDRMKTELALHVHLDILKQVPHCILYFSSEYKQ